jgi:hypothetical protein
LVLSLFHLPIERHKPKMEKCPRQDIGSDSTSFLQSTSIVPLAICEEETNLSGLAQLLQGCSGLLWRTKGISKTSARKNAYTMRPMPLLDRKDIETLMRARHLCISLLPNHGIVLTQTTTIIALEDQRGEDDGALIAPEGHVREVFCAYLTGKCVDIALHRRISEEREKDTSIVLLHDLWYLAFPCLTVGCGDGLKEGQ